MSSGEASYSWASGSRVPVRAAIAAAELARIEEAYGQITAARVVDESRPSDTPLHPAFEWDDSVAGEEVAEESER